MNEREASARGIRSPPRERFPGTAAAVALYAALTIASYYPQSLRAWDSVGYVGDSLESVYIVAWNAHQALRAPTRLFDANILHPHERSLTFTDHQLLSSLSVAPVLWLTDNPVFAYNTAVGLASVFAAMSGRHMALALGVSPLGAWATGALYGFHTYQIHESSRLQIIFHGFLPLALTELVRLLATGERRAAWRAALFMLLQAMCSNYHLLYGCVLFALVALGFLALRPRETLPRLRPLAAAGAIAALLYLPLGLPYVVSAGALGHARELPSGIDLQHYVSTSPSNLVYGAIGAEVGAQQRGPHFVGFLALALAGIALGSWARGRDEPGAGLLPVRVWVPAAALFAALLILLSAGGELRVAGIDLGPGPYRLLYHFVPGFHLMRIPERLGMLAMLFVGLLAGRGLTLLASRLSFRGAAAVALALPLEHLSPIASLDRIPVRDEVPHVYRWLAEQPVSALAEVPTHGEGLVRKESVEMYFSTYHFEPVIHGYMSYPTQLSRLLRRMAAQFPNEAALQAFQRVGVDTVVVHWGRQPGVDLFHKLTGAGRQRDVPRLLRRAGLDLYPRLPDAVAAGRLRLLARFPRPPLYQSTLDEVYRVVASEREAGAPFPGGRRAPAAGWRFAAVSGEPSRAGDGDMSSAWRHPQPLAGEEWLEVSFDRPTEVVGVVLPLAWDTVFPTRFLVEGQEQSGRWRLKAGFGRGHALQLLDQLLDRPRDAAIGFALPRQTLLGLRLRNEEVGTSFEGWSIPELEVRVP